MEQDLFSLPLTFAICSADHSPAVAPTLVYVCSVDEELRIDKMCVVRRVIYT